MSKKFKKIVFRTTALAAGIFCLGAFSCSALNAIYTENLEGTLKIPERYNYIYTSQDIKIPGKDDSFPEYDEKTSSLGKYGECYDIVPIPQAHISYISDKIDGKANHPMFVIDRMLAFDKNDKNAGKFDDINDLLGDDRKLFGEYHLTYDLNSAENKIDVSIEVYDLSKNREKPANVINAKMRKMPVTINNHNFVEFAIERPANCSLIPTDVPIGMVKLYKNDAAGRKCISEVHFAGFGALSCESMMFINSIINFNRNVDEDLKKLGEEPLPEYDAKTNTLGKYGECYDIVPIPQTHISYVSRMRVGKFCLEPAMLIDRMLAFDKNDKDAGNLDDIKDLLDDKRKLFGEYDFTYDPSSSENNILVFLEVYDFSKDRDKPSNSIDSTKMRKIPRTINGRNFVEFAIARPVECNDIPTTGMFRLYKIESSGNKCISEVRFDGFDDVSYKTDMFINAIMNFNRGCDVAKG